MSSAIIRAAFEIRLSTWAAGLTPAMPIAFQNVRFAPPPVDQRWAAGFLLPARTDSLTLDGTHRQYLGVYQVSLHMPPAMGPGAGEALAQALDVLFPKSTQMVQSGLRIYITSPMSAAPALVDDDGRYHIPVSCRYHCDV